MSIGRLGAIATPAGGSRPPAGVPWCADNGCYGKGWPGEDRWLAWLESYTPAERALCIFATAPDVVGDAAATLERSAPWLPVIRELGYPAALVAQNGLEDLDVPWDEFDVLFLGGSLECLPCGFVWPADVRPKRGERCPCCSRTLREWKLGRRARALTAEARRRGKPVHMGRVNSHRRYRYASAIGCTSADGTFLAFGPDANLPRLLAWSRDVPLFDLIHQETR